MKNGRRVATYHREARIRAKTRSVVHDLDLFVLRQVGDLVLVGLGKGLDFFLHLVAGVLGQLFVFLFLIGSLLPSRRTLRMATLDSSVSSLIRDTSLRRVSVDRGGIFNRITGHRFRVNAETLARIAFSISLIVLGSNGRTTIWVGSW